MPPDLYLRVCGLRFSKACAPPRRRSKVGQGLRGLPLKSTAEMVERSRRGASLPFPEEITLDRARDIRFGLGDGFIEIGSPCQSGRNGGGVSASSSVGRDGARGAGGELRDAPFLKEDVGRHGALQMPSFQEECRA